MRVAHAAEFFLGTEETLDSRTMSNTTNMNEGNVHLCCWKASRGHYRLWVKNHPEVATESRMFDEAVMNLCGEICRLLGDGEARIEFDQGWPKSILDDKYANPSFVILEPNEFAEGHAPQVGGKIGYDLQRGLFTEGYCKVCKCGLGTRTDVPVSVSYLPCTDAALGDFVGCGHPLFSEAFVALLDQIEVHNLQFLPVKRTDRGRKRFYELIGHSLAEPVAVKTLEDRRRFRLGPETNFLGFRCEGCGRANSVDYLVDESSPWRFVASA
jgi:hypothetical protein